MLRVYPRYSPNPDDEHYEQYCQIKILLHHPFRTLADLTDVLDDEEQPWSVLFSACNHEHSKDTLRDAKAEASGQEEDDDDEELDPDVMEMDECSPLP